MAKSVSALYFGIVMLFQLTTLILNFDLDKAIQIPGFSSSLFLSLFIIPVFYGVTYLLTKRFNEGGAFLLVSQLIVIAFSLYVISRGMMTTFNAVHNPRNTLTMYMIWLTTVSVFFVFEFYETLLIMLISFVSFSLILPHFQTSTTEVFKNEIVIVILLTLFFFSSRHVFSYRANHYIQLKTIQNKNDQIENANHIKDEILGIVAHDLRNPLGAIESIAMLMEIENEDKNESTTENLSMIKASCEKARIIINDLIEVARNDNEDGFGLQEVDLNDFLLAVIHEWLQNKTGSAKLVFTGTKKPVYTWINKEKMQRVMDNLISNAIKFSDAGTQIEITLKNADGKCFVKVKDKGLGIPEELLPHVFDRFSKASRKGLRGENSVGLGLSIVRQIVKKHGGDIVVDSVEGKGSTFTMMLPQSISPVPVPVG
ncbi:HAMP domain-containing histidine kinase [Mucilaginibacter sp. HMF5004]|uniref:sensor histidine kinase n=1 Tax=Mucilaginibacter rivuli TaxID=2857527 RepID=UPI001C5EF5D5|nr:HAMP domain-containing sensor histidine kinase [Mucilaginibacter rivuli]MBW4891490.1 HAMP domain-containing histidine kinase [Mucilaginibacter rivuli]